MEVGWKGGRSCEGGRRRRRRRRGFMGGCSPIIPFRDVIKMDDAELHEPRTQTRASNPDTCNVSSQSSSHASSISEPRTLTPCDASLVAGLWAAVIECPVRVCRCICIYCLLHLYWCSLRARARVPEVCSVAGGRVEQQQRQLLRKKQLVPEVCDGAGGQVGPHRLTLSRHAPIDSKSRLEFLHFLTKRLATQTRWVCDEEAKRRMRHMMRGAACRHGDPAFFPLIFVYIPREKRPSGRRSPFARHVSLPRAHVHVRTWPGGHGNGEPMRTCGRTDFV